MTKGQIINIFQYLKENQMANYKPVTRLEEFESAISEQSILGLILDDNDEIQYKQEEYLLRIKNVDLPPRPVTPKLLSEWLVFDKEYNLIEKEYIITKIQKPILHSKRTKALFKEYIKSGHPDNIPDELKGSIDFNEQQPRLRNYEEIEQHTYLKDNPDIQQAANNFRIIYMKWLDDYRRKLQIKKLHTNLYNKYQRLLIESDKYELLWCCGLLKWHNINRHMFAHSLDIEFDAKTSDVIIRTRNTDPKYEDDMLNDIEYENKDTYYRFRSHLISSLPNIDFSRFEFCEEYFNNVVHYLDINGVIYKSESKVEDTDSPRLFYSPYLVFRERSATMWVEEFDRVIQHLEEKSTVVPVPLDILVNPELIDKEDDTSQFEAIPQNQELFFPLPINEEQRDIASRLFKSSGVVVQGPPGTGKSHAIANLICHLLANGKRILITSQKAHPLKVIKEKLPENLRSFAVFIGDNSVISYEETRKAVEYIANVVSNIDIDLLDKEIANNRRELDTISQCIAQTENFFKIADEMDNQTILIFKDEYNTLKAAKWVSENAQLEGIEDYINIDQEPPLSLIEYQELISLLTYLSYSDYIQLSQEIPCIEEIPAYKEFQSHAIQYHKANENTFNAKQQLEDLNIYDETLKVANVNLDDYQEVIDIIEQLLEVLNKKGIHEKLIPELIQDEEYFTEKLQEMLHSFEDIKTTIKQYERQLVTNSVTINTQVHNHQIIDDVEELIKKGAIPNSFLQRLIYSNKKYVFEDILVNESKIDTIEKLTITRAHLITQMNYQKAQSIWRNFLTFYNVEYDMDIRSLSELIKMVRWLGALLYTSNYLKEIKQTITKLGSDKFLSLVQLDFNQLCSLKTAILAIMERLHCLQTEEYFDELIQSLTTKLQHKNASDYWKVLNKAAEGKDHELWYETIKELNRIWALNDTYHRVNFLMKKLQDVLPIYTSKLLASYKSQDIALDNRYLDRFKWKKLNDWLKTIDELLQELPEKQEYLENLHQKENRLKVDLIENLACKYLNENVTGSERASLLAWLDYMRRSGQRTTERTRRYAKLAQEEIKKCISAIPVFIMPVAKVIENTDVRENKIFDVLIVDESSQCDLRSLSLFMRAKKIVIVGDDRQISPTRVSSAEKESELINKHLFNIPHSHTFDMRNSLYDKAKFMFKKHIMLKEHFRCVPEIIQFSNDLMYDGQIVPLRVPKTQERIDPPVKTVFVDNGYRNGNINKPEAKAIAELVIKYCSDTKYDDKSMGIISLQGEEQATLINEFLYESLSKTEIEQRKLIAGDAYHFQGDERDVMFMSMVVATEGDKKITALTQESNLQRFNVAASRARDEMVLFHSVMLSDLSTKCVRHRLLSYCMNPHRVSIAYNLVKHKFDSPFEEEVFKVLTAKGYYTKAQVPAGVGKKRIDLVVEGLNNNRLAIECDGDAFHPPEQYEADLERQRTLERVGWIFFRIRGSQFYRHREKSLKPLWKKLEEMGIYPYEPMPNASEQNLL